jgi:SAM-dependent methyltransferase
VNPADTRARPDAFDAFERRGWGAAARGYDEFFTEITDQVIDPLLAAVAAEPGDQLLDLACGPGHLIAAASERGIPSTGVDVTPSMLELARRAAPTASVRWCDVQHLPFPDDSFDLVTAAFVLMHVADPDRVVAEASRVLRPGGRLGVAVWDVPERARLLGWMGEAIERAGVRPPDDTPAGPSFFAHASDEAMSRLLEMGGLDEVAVRTLAFTHRVRSVDQLWRGLVEGTVRTAALVRGQDAASLRRIRHELAVLVEPHTDATGIAVPVSVRLGVGTRR